MNACSGGDEPAPARSFTPALTTPTRTAAPSWTSRSAPTTAAPAPTTTTTRPAPAPDPDPDPDPDRDRRAPAPPRDDDDNDTGGGSVYYKNCAAVRAAGAAPIRRGDPGYARHLDRDGDGEGCAGD
ncbi:excalibur calcium-binding domain-containing protein [Pseudonocardia zijingensis]|uniref:excalibur calcium-binding domain-containing protein n=1 Tax=Pseudonocardia zijingensis TaxID=153376 RepID=UPI0031D91564